MFDDIVDELGMEKIRTLGYFFTVLLFRFSALPLFRFSAFLNDFPLSLSACRFPHTYPPYRFSSLRIATDRFSTINFPPY